MVDAGGEREGLASHAIQGGAVDVVVDVVGDDVLAIGLYAHDIALEEPELEVALHGGLGLELVADGEGVLADLRREADAKAGGTFQLAADEGGPLGVEFDATVAVDHATGIGGDAEVIGILVALGRHEGLEVWFVFTIGNGKATGMDADGDEGIAILLLQGLDGAMGTGTVGAVLTGELLKQHATLHIYGRQFHVAVVLGNLVAGTEEEKEAKG